MTMEYLPPAILKKAVFELVADCRRRLLAGEVDVTEVDKGVRVYCDALKSLPLEESRRYKPDLEEMMVVVTELSDMLVAARDAVSMELKALDHLKRANVAYQKSDAVGGPYKRKDGDE